jgi:HEAT repeat protein
MLLRRRIVATTRPNIWQLQSRRNIQALIKALEYPDPEVRKRAAGALRALDAVQAVSALKAALRDETDAQVRTNLMMALHVLDHRTDVSSLIRSKNVNGLIAALKSRRPENVIAAAIALGELGDRIAVEPLVILFQNTSLPPKVRLAAAEALLQLKSAPAVVTLLGALRRDSWQVRRNAALIEALNDPQPVVRRTAAVALRRIGTAEAVAALRARFASQPPETAQSGTVLSTRTVGAPLPVSSPQVATAASAAPAASSQVEEKASAQSSVPEAGPAGSAAAASIGVSPAEESGTAPALPAEQPSLRTPSSVKRLIAFFKGRDGS